MVDFVKDVMKFWDKFEKDLGLFFCWMSGLFNFGDKNFGGDSFEGILMGLVFNLEWFGMFY